MSLSSDKKLQSKETSALEIREMPLKDAEFDDAWIEHSYQAKDVLAAIDSLVWRLRRGGPIRFYAVMRDGEMILGAPVRVLSSAILEVAGSSDRFDFVDFIYNPNVSRELHQEAFGVLLDHWKRNGVTEVRWNYLETAAKSYDYAKAYLLDDNQAVESVLIPLAAPSFEEHFSDLSKGTRQNIRTAYNRSKRDGRSLEFHIYQAVEGWSEKATEELKAIRKQHLDVYLKRQATRYDHGDIIFRLFKRKADFLHGVISSPYGFMADITLDGQIAAFMHGYSNQRRNSIEIPRLALNPEFSFYSPGILLVVETLKYLYQTSDRPSLDLCRGTEQYKLSLGGELYTTNSFTIKLDG